VTTDNVTPLSGKSRAAAMAPTSEAEALTSEVWPDLLPLDGADAPPPFPTDQLPPVLSRFVEAQAEAFRTSPDLLGTFSLAAVSTVTGGRWRVEPEGPGGWSEPLVLHTVGVATPSGMKSPAMAAALAPLVALEAELRERYEPEAAEAAQLRRIDEKRLAEYETKAAKATPEDPDNYRELAADLARDLRTKPVFSVPALFTTDSTAERVEQLLAENAERFAWLDAEGGLFTMLAGRYSAKNGAANLDVFVKGHSGDPVKVQRVGRDPVNLNAPALTVGIAVQPSALIAAAKNPELMGRGVFARMLFSWPDLPVVDRSKPSRSVPAAVAGGYTAAIRDLWAEAEKVEAGSRRALGVDPDALDVLRDFFGWTHAERSFGGSLAAEGLDSWAGKLDGQAVRLAGILTLAENPKAESVTMAAATRAVTLARYYFVPHASRAFGEVDLLPELSAARKCWQAVTDARPTPTRWKEWPAVVSKRDVMESVKGSRSLGLNTAEGVGAALVTLANSGYLQELPKEPGARGNPSRWAVRPGLLDSL